MCIIISDAFYIVRETDRARRCGKRYVSNTSARKTENIYDGTRRTAITRARGNGVISVRATKLTRVQKPKKKTDKTAEAIRANVFVIYSDSRFFPARFTPGNVRRRDSARDACPEWPIGAASAENSITTTVVRVIVGGDIRTTDTDLRRSGRFRSERSFSRGRARQ